ncbi:hypothetical protein N7537_009651 [Penicillium hordei]|uniref:IgE-binding protein n=1 Tax=Penicillium hordei TaxID=40994 RepID=A0AAD6DTB0_9EURO|nr:uncharacterized protein N7537_009651 [Penicillium hordei]KAJ5592747.1 hypothetical protein N7537_009651 [Penicillium hordei]
MKQSTILALIPFLAGANSLTTPQKPAHFDLMAVSDGPVQYRALAVSSTFFWLGKGDGYTDSYCPPNVEKAGRCPPGRDTVLKDANTLDTIVPDQVIYVDSNYAVRYSGPKSVNIDSGGKTGGFKYVPGSRYGQWAYQGDGFDDFLACPYNNGIYQVFINSPDATPPRGQKLDVCVPFTAGALEYDLPANVTAAAWEY